MPVEALRHAQERLTALADLASELSATRSRSQVADVVVAHGMRAAEADTCTLYLLDETETRLELLGERGIAPAIVEQIRVVDQQSYSARTLTAVKSGDSIWAETPEEYEALFPRLATQTVSGARAKAFWSVPLVVEGRPIGLVAMGFYAPRRFPPEERAFVETFTKQCAQALQRATRFERQDQAQRSLTTILRSIGDAVIATDTLGRVTFMNPVAERLTGWAASDARSRDLGDVFRIFSEKTGEPVESPVRKVLREGTIVGLANHTELIAKDGRRIPIADSGAPVEDEDGAILGVVLVFRDVTQEKIETARREFLAAASEALSSSLDYRATLATVTRLAVPHLADWCAITLVVPGQAALQQVAVAHKDPEKVKHARELGERYPSDPHASTGAPQVARSGKSELYVEIPKALLEASAKDADHLRMIRELNLESAMVVPLLGRERTLGVMTFVYASSGRRYTNDDLAFAEDFARRAATAIETATAFRELEEARLREQDLRHEAELANQAKDQFLATVSHELRTPLNAILGWTVTLRSAKPPEHLDRPLSIIERNARAQARLIEDVLDVARIINGKLSLSPSAANFSDAVAAAVEAVRPAADAKGVVLETSFDDSSAIEIMIDPDRFQQVIWNLLTNAVKFTPKGGRVTVRSLKEGSHVKVIVKDTGEGIAADVLPFVFDHFRQADASTTRRHGGLGLGLAIVKQLVSAHGGKVEAKSDGLGTGSEFTVVLPADAATNASRPGSRSWRNLTPQIEALSATPRLDGLKVLVIDDEEDARAMADRVLAMSGAEVLTTESADAGFQAFLRIRPDVIICDISMPVTDGYALVKKVRSLSVTEGGRTPAIALTANARQEDVDRAFAAGYQSHVLKPVEPARLVTIVANLGGRTSD